MIVERTDFISVPVTDMERSKEFYGETLGLELVVHGEDQGFPEYQLGENVSLYLLDMKSIGSEFTAPHSGSIAFRVPDVAEARRELEEGRKGFEGDTLDTTVCHMAFFRDPDGNASCCIAATPPPHDDADTRAGREAVRRAAAAVDQGRALALHRPARLRPCVGHGRGQTPAVSRPAMLDLDVAARALVTESGIEILGRPQASASSCCRGTTRRR